MRTRNLLSIVTLTLAGLAGCFSPPPEAPEELNDLLRFIYREWDHPEPSVMASAFVQMDKFLRDVPADGKRDERAFSVVPLEPEDLEGITWPTERNLEDAPGLSVARLSEFEIGDHVKLQLDDDQLAIEPSAKEYVRTFLEGRDCFADRSCLVLRTSNDVLRSNVALEVRFELFKDLRWVKFGEEGKERWGIAARSWIEKSSPGKSSGTAIHTSFSFDIFVPNDEGRVWRFQGVWSESECSFCGGDMAASLVTSATDDALAEADKVIRQRYHSN